MSEQEGDEVTGGPKHAICEVGLGVDTVKEAIEFRVGPACNWTVFHPRPYFKAHVALWGESLSKDDMRMLGDACHELEQEAADMSMYDAASEADGAESGFIWPEEKHGFDDGSEPREETETYRTTRELTIRPQEIELPEGTILFEFDMGYDPGRG